MDHTTAFDLGVRLGVLAPPFADDLTLPLRDPRPISEADRAFALNLIDAADMSERRRPVVALTTINDLASLRAYYASAPLRPGARRHG